MTRLRSEEKTEGPAHLQKQGCVCYDGVSSQIHFVLLSSRTLLEKRWEWSRSIQTELNIYMCI